MSLSQTQNALTGRKRRWSINGLVDNLFFVFSGVMALWLAGLVLTASFGGWLDAWFVLPFWLILAYVALPRLHRILTNIYVPDYFIGRSRTEDGLLGDPINVALRGSQDQVEAAMKAAKWTRADEITLRSSWRIIASTITGRSYDEAPVSNLRLFGRQQDFAYQQEVENSPAKRHHVRFWKTPEGWLLPGGRQVDWLAAGTFDRSVGLSLFTFQVTHKIDPHIDVERDHIVSSISGANTRVRVETISGFSTGYHSRNGGGDAIQTDGDLPVVDLRALEMPKQDDGVSHLGKLEDLRFQDKLMGTTVVQAEVSGTDVVVPTLERPLPTIFGSLFAVLSAVLTMVGAFVVIQSRDIEQELNPMGATAAELTSIDQDVVLVVIVFSVALAIFQLVLALFVWIGHNLARIAQMAVTALSLVITFVNVSNGHTKLILSLDLLGTNLVTVTLEILVVLALSSAKARAFARHRRA